MTLNAHDVNESYVKIITDDIEQKVMITNYLSVYTEGYQFAPAFKAGVWDGKKKFYKLAHDGILVPKGLIHHVRKQMKKESLEIEYKNLSDYYSVSEEELHTFIKTLKLPFEPYDYQIEACMNFINKGRVTEQLATGAGKSLVVYILSNFFKERGEKTLVIVPSVSLVNQIRSDFNDYGFTDHESVHVIFAGKEKTLSNPITISTWQSLYDNTHLLHETDVVIIDEAHTAKSEVFSELIMPNLVNCRYRLGLSGTIADLNYADRMELIGSMGYNVKIINAQGLIERGLGTPIQINCVFFNYTDEEKKLVKNLTYQKEIKVIEGHHRRNLKLAKMTNKISKSGNTIILFSTIVHGKMLMELILQDKFGVEDVVLLEKSSPQSVKSLIKDGEFPLKVFTNTELDDKQKKSILATFKKEGIPADYINRFDALERYDIYMIYGAIEAEERERIRKLLETKEDAIVVGNYQVMSTGINIKRLHNIILAAPTKSSIRLRQTIGRGIRLHTEKEVTKIWDIVDDFSITSKSGKTTTKNHALKHFDSRMNVYLEDGFPLKEVEIIL